MDRGILGIVFMLVGSLLAILIGDWLGVGSWGVDVLIALAFIGSCAMTIIGGIFVAYSGLVQKIGKMNFTLE